MRYMAPTGILCEMVRKQDGLEPQALAARYPNAGHDVQCWLVLALCSAPWTQYMSTGVLLILLVFSLARFRNGSIVEGVARRCEVALEK